VDRRAPLESAPEQRCSSYPPRSNQRTSRRHSRSSARRRGTIGSPTHNLLGPTGMCSGPITFLHCHRLDPIRHLTFRPGITVGQQHFSDLVYADHTTFLVDSPTQASSCLSGFSEARQCSVCVFHDQRLKFKPSALDHSHRLFWSMETPLTLSRPSHISEVYSHPMDTADQTSAGVASSVMSSLDCIWKECRHFKCPLDGPSHKNTYLPRSSSPSY